mgnify:CR=1 FL=1
MREVRDLLLICCCYRTLLSCYLFSHVLSLYLPSRTKIVCARAVGKEQPRADGTVVRPDGEPIGRLREDGMVVGPGGEIVGQRSSDGAIVEGARQEVAGAVARWAQADRVSQRGGRRQPDEVAEQQADEQRTAMKAVMDRQRLNELVASWEESERTA